MIKYIIFHDIGNRITIVIYSKKKRESKKGKKETGDGVRDNILENQAYVWV